MTYLKLWWFQNRARAWGRQLEAARVAVTVAEAHMWHYRREWQRLLDTTTVYQTPAEREAGIRAAMENLKPSAPSAAAQKETP